MKQTASHLSSADHGGDCFIAGLCGYSVGYYDMDRVAIPEHDEAPEGNTRRQLKIEYYQSN